MRVATVVGVLVVGLLLSCAELGRAQDLEWWRALDSANLTTLSPSVFASVTADMIKNIKTTASQGFTSEQMSAIPAEAYSGFRGGNPLFDEYYGSQFPYMPAEAFSSVSAAQISYITPGATAFLNRGHISRIPAASAAGFSRGQLASIPAVAANGADERACSAFTSEHIANIPVASIAGFTYLCTLRFASAALSAVSRTQLREFSAEVDRNWGYSPIAGLSAQVVAKIPVSSFNAWTSGQIGAFTRDICTGITLDQFATLPSYFVGAFRPVCVDGLQESVWSIVTAYQLGGFTPDTVQNISTSGFTNIPPSLFSAWTPSQVASFSLRVCAVMSAEQLTNITLDATSSINGACASQFQSSALSGISSDQLSKFAPETVRNFSSSVVQNIPASAFSGWTSNQIASFSTQVCESLTPEQVSQITASSFGGFTSQCFTNLNNASLAVVSVEQFSSLSLSVISSLTYQVGLIAPEVLSSLTETQAASFGACAFFTSANVRFVSANVFAQLSVKCVVAIPPYVWASVSAEQIQTLSLLACGNLSSEAVAQLQDGAILALSLSQLGSFSISGVSGLRGDHIFSLFSNFGLDFVNLYDVDKYSDFSLVEMARFKSRLSIPLATSLSEPASWSQLTWIQMAVLTNNVTLPTTYWKVIPAKSIGGIRADQVQTLFQPPYIFKLVEDYQGAYFAPDTLAAMSVEQLSNLHTTVFSYFPSVSVNALPLSSWQSFSAEIIGSLPNATLAALDCTLAQGMTSIQLQAFTREQEEIYYQRLLECHDSTTTTATTTTTTTTGLSATSTTGGFVTSSAEVTKASALAIFLAGLVVFAVLVV